MSGIFMLKGRGASRLLAAVALAVTAGPASGDPPASPERSYIEHRSPPGSPALPFNDAVRSGDMLYVAGHLGIDPKTGSVPSDPEAEAGVERPTALGLGIRRARRRGHRAECGRIAARCRPPRA